jgi:hypothetical protein
MLGFHSDHPLATPSQLGKCGLVARTYNCVYACVPDSFLRTPVGRLRPCPHEHNQVLPSSSRTGIIGSSAKALVHWRKPKNSILPRESLFHRRRTQPTRTVRKGGLLFLYTVLYTVRVVKSKLVLTNLNDLRYDEAIKSFIERLKSYGNIHQDASFTG